MTPVLLLRRLRRVAIVAIAMAIAILQAAPAHAQGGTLQPGQVVIVPDSGDEKEGRVVRQDRNGVLVRFPMYDGRWDEKNGPTCYYAPGDIRLKPEPAPVPAPRPQPRPRPQPQPEPQPQPDPETPRAEDGAFQPGEKVIAPDGSRGQVVEQNEYGVLVRFPTVDGKMDPRKSPQTYFDPKDLRHADGKAAATPGQPDPARPTPGQPNPGRTDPEQPKEDAPEGTAGGPMTKEEVLGFLKERIGDNFWTHPKKPAVIAELEALIRKRGVNFRTVSGDDFSNKLSGGGGNDGTIWDYCVENYGTPKKMDWLIGNTT